MTDAAAQADRLRRTDAGEGAAPRPLVERVLARVRAYPAKRGTVGRRIAGELHAWYVVEGDEGLTPLSQRVANELGLTRVQLDERVAANLWTRMVGVTFHRHGSEEPFSVMTGTPHTAAALLLDDLWDEIAQDVSGELIVRVVNHSLLMCAGRGEPAALARMVAGAEVRGLLRWRGGWEPWSPVAEVAQAA